MSLYEKPVRLLMRDFISNINLGPAQVFTKEQIVDWFKANYPLIKLGTINGHLYRLSTNNKNRLHHNLCDDGSDDLFFQIDSTHFRLYRNNSDPQPIRKCVDSDSEVSQESSSNDSGDSEFAYEQDLRDYLSKNLCLIEPGLRLYSEEGISGIEFPAGGKFIDILAVDPINNYVVIELKVSRGYDRVVGQLLYYMTWIERNQAEPSQNVRGIIVAKEVSNDLKLACARVSDINLFEYELSVSLKKVSV